MWSRLLRIFSTGALAYSNPLQFVLGLIMIVVAPYLVYLFWGSIIIILLMAIALFFGIRFIIKRMRKQQRFN